jgi:predicted amidophosphoribosyltransferase
MTKWYIECCCVECKRELSDYERFYNYGMCPKCGYRAYGAGSIVNTIDRPYILERINPWWTYFHKDQYKKVYRDEMGRK